MPDSLALLSPAVRAAGHLPPPHGASPAFPNGRNSGTRPVDSDLAPRRPQAEGSACRRCTGIPPLQR